MPPQAELKRSRDLVIRSLAAEQTVYGWWEGSLSSSALSTATALVALSMAHRHSSHPDSRLPPLISKGIQWLARHQNNDGGWGDTSCSPSNLSTTALCWAALGAAGTERACHPNTADRAHAWLARQVGSSAAEDLIKAIVARYGTDRTFSVPILTHCALCGRLGEGATAWSSVLPLPFELAAFPRQWFARLQLPVVSYALPALIAIGQVRHHHLQPKNPVTRILRNGLRQRTLRVLEEIQPSNGGFLEAAPLTSFVTMSLASMGLAEHPVVRKAVEFLIQSVRPDGSWPIDTNLRTWVTTLSVNALLPSNTGALFTKKTASDLANWLISQQYKTLHNYTQAPPGGWAWTDLPGGVPDADDTSGALLALQHLRDFIVRTEETNTEPGSIPPEVTGAGDLGIRWLLGLQNKDGGVPTFCRGWGTLPFDRSSPDITAHAIRAWLAWLPRLSEQMRKQANRAVARAKSYLIQAQDPQGAWVPLWFGNQYTSDQTNRLYGTSRVVLALEQLRRNASLSEETQSARIKALRFLVTAQHSDGGWGGDTEPRVRSLEETALALEALATARSQDTALQDLLDPAIEAGSAWMIRAIDSGRLDSPSPIGLYFAKLWYHERLYPKIFAAAAFQSLLTQPSR